VRGPRDVAQVGGLDEEEQHRLRLADGGGGAAEAVAEAEARGGGVGGGRREGGAEGGMEETEGVAETSSPVLFCSRLIRLHNSRILPVSSIHHTLEDFHYLPGAGTSFRLPTTTRTHSWGIHNLREARTTSHTCPSVYPPSPSISD
jgi:hypothetical protein